MKGFGFYGGRDANAPGKEENESSGQKRAQRLLAPGTAFKGDIKAMAFLRRFYEYYYVILNLVIKFNDTSIEFVCNSGAHTRGERISSQNLLPKKCPVCGTRMYTRVNIRLV